VFFSIKNTLYLVTLVRRIKIKMENIICRECGKIDKILIKESEDYICKECVDKINLEFEKKK